jgi:hypothetical protein
VAPFEIAHAPEKKIMASNTANKIGKMIGRSRVAVISPG